MPLTPQEQLETLQRLARLDTEHLCNKHLVIQTVPEEQRVFLLRGLVTEAHKVARRAKDVDHELTLVLEDLVAEARHDIRDILSRRRRKNMRVVKT